MEEGVGWVRWRTKEGCEMEHQAPYGEPVNPWGKGLTEEQEEQIRRMVGQQKVALAELRGRDLRERAMGLAIEIRKSAEVLSDEQLVGTAEAIRRFLAGEDVPREMRGDPLGTLGESGVGPAE